MRGVSPVGRTVVVEPISTDAGCPSCGVMVSRFQARPVRRVKDVSSGGKDLEVLERKRRLACLESECERRSFVQTTGQITLRSRLTTRLVGAIGEAASTEVCSVCVSSFLFGPLKHLRGMPLKRCHEPPCRFVRNALTWAYPNRDFARYDPQVVLTTAKLNQPGRH